MQFVCAVSFGVPLYFFYETLDISWRLVLSIVCLLALVSLTYTISEKTYMSIRRWLKKREGWKNLSSEELEYIKYYITENTIMRYVPAYNGTYQNSGIINPLRAKGILYLASNESEWRGESWMSAGHEFPININDNAFQYFKKKFNE